MSYESLVSEGVTSDLEEVYRRAEALIDGSKDDHPISLLANLSALLYHSMEDLLWVGFYAVKDEELVLYPFQGPVACTSIRKGRGVCGTAWAEERSVVVPDVEAFPGHIACSSLARSELVVPVFDQKGGVALILDLDSASLNRFGREEQLCIEQIARLLSANLVGW
ncbi:MAG: GAF domain-containing protein [Porphyromonas sp.]|nr:GAF domain-containing protein [Porphyromonas sp.]